MYVMSVWYSGVSVIGQPAQSVLLLLLPRRCSSDSFTRHAGRGVLLWHTVSGGTGLPREKARLP
jgi:hypothetical protein